MKFLVGMPARVTAASQVDRVAVARHLGKAIVDEDDMTDDDRSRIGILCEAAVLARARARGPSATPVHYRMVAYSAVTRLSIPTSSAVPVGARVGKPDTWYYAHTPQGEAELRHKAAVRDVVEAAVNERLRIQAERTKHIINGMPPCRKCESTEHVSQVGESHSKAAMDEMARYKYLCRKCGEEWEQGR